MIILTQWLMPWASGNNNMEKMINQLVGSIKENMARATPSQKAKFASLLERVMASESAQPQEYTPEMLAQQQQYLEKLLPSVRKLSKESAYELHDMEMKLRMLVPDGSFNKQGRVYDVVESIEEAIGAIDVLQSRMIEMENSLVKSIQRIGWDIADLEDERKFAEDVESQHMSDLDPGPRNTKVYLQGYKCYQNKKPMVNPYQVGTAEHRDWADGYHQSVVDRHQNISQ